MFAWREILRGMAIVGIEGLSVDEMRARIGRGAKFVIFSYTISLLVVTFRRSSEVHFLGPNDSPLLKGLPYTCLSFFFGWWGFPWGFIYTPMAIVENLSGGKNVTAEVMSGFERVG